MQSLVLRVRLISDIEVGEVSALTEMIKATKTSQIGEEADFLKQKGEFH